jgi:hypothetical protein
MMWIGGAVKFWKGTREGEPGQRPWAGGEITRVGVDDDGGDLMINLLIWDV